MKYKIHWLNKENGRSGLGKTLFTKERAMEIERELNAEYPAFVHTAIPEDQKEPPPAPEPEPPKNIIQFRL